MQIIVDIILCILSTYYIASGLTMLIMSIKTIKDIKKSENSKIKLKNNYYIILPVLREQNIICDSIDYFYNLTKNEEKVNEYTVIIYGDVDGSGIINARDLLMLQRYILKKIDLLPIQIRASVIDKQNDEPKAVDLLKIQRHILGLYVIEQ